MCGLTGFLLPAGCPTPDLETWSAMLAHRGPDQVGAWAEERLGRRAGLGTRRLSIQDLSSAGSQPMISERFAIAFNGEIYNHLDLRRDLSGARFFSRSDTETILRALEAWGVGATLSRLNGVYGLAIWDREHARMTLARDPMGVKPLYVARRGDAVYFASEARALREIVTGQVDREALALYLMYGYVPAPWTLMAGVEKLRPGEVITFGGSEPECGSIRPAAWEKEIDLPAEYGERVELVREAVTAAVERQLISDVPLGIFLSGGLDSTIVAHAARATGAELTSLSVRLGEIGRDAAVNEDARIAACYAHSMRMCHLEVLVEPALFRDDVDGWMRSTDEPVLEPSFISQVAMSRAARAAGVPVILTGDGADEGFHGYSTYRALLRGARYDRIPMFGSLAACLARVPLFSAPRRENYGGAARVWRAPLHERYAVTGRVLFEPAAAAKLAGLEQREVEAVVERFVAGVAERASRFPAAGRVSRVERFARLELASHVPDHYNMRLDKTTMSASVEARVPFQDLELLNLALRLPCGDKIRNGRQKAILRDAFAHVIPAATLNRPKQTFQAPVLSWVAGSLSGWVEEVLAGSPLRPSRGGPEAPVTPRREAYRTWSLAALETWRRSLGLSL